MKPMNDDNYAVLAPGRVPIAYAGAFGEIETAFNDAIATKQFSSLDLVKLNHEDESFKVLRRYTKDRCSR